MWVSIAYRAPKSRAKAPPARATGRLPSKPVAMLLWMGSSEGAFFTVAVAVAVAVEEGIRVLDRGVLVWIRGVDDEGVAVGVTALTRTRVLVMVVVKVEVWVSAATTWDAPKQRAVEMMVESFIVVVVCEAVVDSKIEERS